MIPRGRARVVGVLAPQKSGGGPRLTIWLGIALFAYYLLILGGHQYSIDGIVMFQSAKRLLFHHSLVLDPPVRWAGDIHLSKWSVGMTLAYVPVLALWSPLFHWLPALQEIPWNPAVAYNPHLYQNLPYLLCSWLNPLLTAVTACVVFQLGGALGLSRQWSVAAALAYGVASPAVGYARFDFAQPLAGLALTVAVRQLVGAGSPSSLRPLLWAGGGLGVALLTRPELAVLVAWIAAWLAVRERRLGLRGAAVRAAVLLGPAVTCGLVYLWFNLMKFGSVTRTGHQPVADMFSVAPVRVLEGLTGLLASPQYGLLLFFPLAWLTLPGLWRLHKEMNGAGSLFSGLIGLGLVLYGSFEIWWAGWSWGPRFLIPLIPLLALASTVWAAQPGVGAPRRALFLALAALGVVASLTGVLMDVVPFNLWVAQVLRPSESGMRLAASPLVSGWRFVGLTHPDLFWLGLARAGNGWSLVALGAVAALLGTMAWAGVHLRRLLLAESGAVDSRRVPPIRPGGEGTRKRRRRRQ